MTKRDLAVVFLAALLLRVVVLLELADTPLVTVLLGDAEVFVAWGRELAAGAWLGEEVFFQAPLYPYVLGLVFAAGGGTSAVLALHALLGAGTALLVARASARLFDRRAGWIAGLGAAAYAPSLWLEGIVQKTALATFLTSAVVLLLIHRIAEDEEGDPPTTWSTFGLGGVLGLLVLVRENAFVLAVPIVLWLVVAPQRRRALVGWAAGLLLVLVPVGLRNAALGGAFLPTASNAGVNFYLGNRAEADGLYTPLVPGRGHARYEAEDARRLAEEDAGGPLSPAEVSAYWLGRGVDDVLAEPLRWGVLLAWKSVLVLHRTECMDAQAFEAHRAESRALELTSWLFRFGLLLPLAVYGMGLALRDRDGLWPLALGALVLAASIVLFFVTARFRVGLVPLLLPFAGRGVVGLSLFASDAVRRRADLPLVVIAASFALVANLPLTTWPLSVFGSLGGDPIATTESNLASARLALGQPQEAYEHATRALERDEEDPFALFNLAQAARELGRDEEAIAAFREAARREPSFTGECLMSIGLVQATGGDVEEAAKSFRAAAQAAPDDPRVHYNLGIAERQLGRDTAARAAYERAIALDPSFPDAHHNLGYLAERGGDALAAAARYRAALEADPGFTLSLERLTRLLAMHPDESVRDGVEAVEHARVLVERGGETPTTLELLAAALAETGDYEGARITQTRAVRAARSEEQRARLEPWVAWYEAGRVRRLER